jgi:S1-C subfamily serine protease
VQPGDVIVALGTANLAQAENGGRALVENMRSVVPDKPVKLRVLRDGKALDLTVTPRAVAPMHRGALTLPHVAPMPRVDAELFGAPDAEPMILRLHEMLGGVAGMELATLSPKLGQYFGTDKGVLVLRAPVGPDWKLEDGDVITSIDGRIPNSGAHATRILSSYQPGEKINLKLLRQRKVLSLEIVTPAPRAMLLERTPRPERP